MRGSEEGCNVVKQGKLIKKEEVRSDKGEYKAIPFMEA